MTGTPPAIPSRVTPPRKVFALTGRSPALDPRTHAVRSDIADIRLADQVFAPHYAQAMRRTLAVGARLRAGRGDDAETLATLAAGDAFDLLDVTLGAAWGIAPERGLVGYLDAGALAPVVAQVPAA